MMMTRKMGKLRGAVRRFIGNYQRVVLLYHRVAESNSDPWALCVSPRHFAEHLEVLHRLGSVVRLRQLVHSLTCGDLPERAIVISFDDGYADNLHAAKPLFDRYGMPVTVFLTPGHLASEFWWD